MKKLILTALLIGTWLHAEERVVPLQECTTEMVQQFSKGELIVECQEGTKIPFNLFMRGEYLSLSEGVSQWVEIKKACFIKLDGETFLFSSDLEKWSSFSEFFTGSLAFIFTPDEGAQLSLELNQR